MPPFTEQERIEFGAIFDERELKVIEEYMVKRELTARAAVRHFFRLGQMTEAMADKGYRVLYTKDDDVFDPLQPAGPKMAPMPAPTADNSCNRHHDCKRAEADFYAREGRQPNPGFHCHDDECEDCFGS